MATAVVMKRAVATSERDESRANPQTPCPLAQPPPRRVPMPTSSPPAMMITDGAGMVIFGNTPPQSVKQRAGDQPNQERDPPRDITCPGRPQTTDDTADSGDATIGEPRMVAESPISTPPIAAETGVKCSIKGSSGGCCSNRDEIGVSTLFRVIEDGNHLWKHTVNRDFLGLRHRKRRIFGVSRAKQAQCLRDFLGSSTVCASAAIERPVIAMGSELSGSIVNETRLSGTKFFAFWLCGLHRKSNVRPSFTYPPVIAWGQPSGLFVATVMIRCRSRRSRIFSLKVLSMRIPASRIAGREFYRSSLLRLDARQSRNADRLPPIWDI